MLKAVLDLFGLSLVWNRYPKVCHMAGVTKRSIIAYDKIEFAKRISVSIPFGLLR